jgi:hypothetical protein
MTPKKLLRYCPLVLPLLLSLSAFQSAFAQAQLSNLSTRMRLRPPSVNSPSDIAIAGFIMTGVGGAGKGVLLRGLGPTLLPVPLSPVLSDPLLTLNQCASCPLTNDSWYVPFSEGVGYLFATASAGPPPPIYLEAALYRTLPLGIYTAAIQNSPANTTLGFALVELYDLDLPNGKVVNLSTRAFVGTGDEIVIAGFILTGSGSESIVVRGLGPSLAASNISQLLADPVLELRNVHGVLLLANDNWQDSPVQAAQITALGLAPSNNLEAALIMTLPPGLYTALLAGRGNTTGNGLIEIYDVGP